MSKQHKSVKRYYLLFILAVLAIDLFGGYYLVRAFRSNDNFNAQIPLTQVIQNDLEGWSVPDGGNISPVPFGFARIMSVAFGQDDRYLFVKYQLADRIPNDESSLPVISGDQMTSLIYIVTLNSHYFDAEGHKNVGDPEATLAINIFGNKPAAKENLINVDGEMIAGGKGYDYFIVRYPYKDILFNQDDDTVVITARALVTSKLWPRGLTQNELNSARYAAVQGDNQEIKIKLDPSLSKEISY